MKIRHAYPSEINECDSVLRAAFDTFVKGLGRTLSAKSFAGLSDAVAENRVLIALDGMNIVGVLVFTIRSDCFNIDYLAMHPELHGRGTGSALIKKLESEAAIANLAAIELNTVEFMLDLVQMYVRHGFDVVRRGPPDHTRDDFVRVYMRKPMVTT